MSEAAAMAGQLRREKMSSAVGEGTDLAPKGGLAKTTSMLLRTSWLNLITSFGLTLIYINAHVFMHFLFPSLFCKLGQEWIPGQEFAGQRVDGIKQSNRMLGLIETMLLVALDLGLVFVILMAITVTMAIVQAISGFFGYILNFFF